MCKNKEQCPNNDKCKCVIDYTKVEGVPMTTSPHNLLNKEDMIDEHFDLNAVGIFDEDDCDE